MNPLLMKIADGTSFFVGMTVVMAAVLAQVWLKQRLFRALLSIAIFAGVLLVILSSTPLPISEYVVWLLLLVAAIVTLCMGQSRWDGMRVRLLGVGLFAIFSLMLCLQEWRYRWEPTIHVGPAQQIYIIGDSLSAGVGRGEKVWPAVLAERTGLTVTNLAVGGAKIKGAPAQARAVTRDGAVVILEIGGNDVLGNGKAPSETAVFSSELEQLLETLSSRHHRIAMFELPLPPLSGGYGRAQRRLAGMYGVALIPKAVLADTLALPDGTLDGLHLSQKGHDYLAGRVQALLESVSNLPR